MQLRPAIDAISPPSWSDRSMSIVIVDPDAEILSVGLSVGRNSGSEAKPASACDTVRSPARWAWSDPVSPGNAKVPVVAVSEPICDRPEVAKLAITPLSAPPGLKASRMKMLPTRFGLRADRLTEKDAKTPGMPADAV
jgi:hypothetical protein